MAGLGLVEPSTRTQIVRRSRHSHKQEGKKPSQHRKAEGRGTSKEGIRQEEAAKVRLHKNRRTMGFMLRVRLASFFAGAAAASAAGGYFLYKDYKLAHDSIALQVKGLRDHVDARYKALDKRLEALEGQKNTEAALDVDTSSD